MQLVVGWSFQGIEGKNRAQPINHAVPRTRVTFPVLVWVVHFAKIASQSIEIIQGEIIIGNGMVDEGDFVGKSLDSVQVFLNLLSPFLNHCELLLQLHSPNMRSACIHGMQFLPCLLGFFYQWK